VTGDADLLPVATCGTAVTPTQARLIVETAATYNVPVVVAMDGDSAGRSATLTAGEQLRRHGLDVLVAVLPNGTDPAEYTANPDRSLNVFRQSGALPLLTAQVQNCIAVQGDRMQWVEGRLAAARHDRRHPHQPPAGARNRADKLDLNRPRHRALHLRHRSRHRLRQRALPTTRRNSHR